MQHKCTLYKRRSLSLLENRKEKSVQGRTSSGSKHTQNLELKGNDDKTVKLLNVLFYFIVFSVEKLFPCVLNQRAHFHNIKVKTSSISCNSTGDILIFTHSFFLVHLKFFLSYIKVQNTPNRWRTLPHKHPRQVTQTEATQVRSCFAS